LGAKERRLQREVQAEVARRLYEDKVAAEVDRQRKIAVNQAAAKTALAADRARRSKEFAESAAGQQLGAMVRLAIVCLFVFGIAFGLGYIVNVGFILVCVAAGAAVLYWKRRSIKYDAFGTGSLIALAVGLLAGGGRHADASAVAANEAASARAKSAQMEREHEQRLAWSKAHPREVEDRKRRTRQQVAKQTATETTHVVRPRTVVLGYAVVDTPDGDSEPIYATFADKCAMLREVGDAAQGPSQSYDPDSITAKYQSGVASDGATVAVLGSRARPSLNQTIA
jgi:hypothetical protein